ncbi:MAG: LytR cell envelope-related transcriptional attenuator [Gaiellaceae bacterium]|nr:LytR cell envelope-related transcriptional attenuator [Gaiellaceae bacterium]
MQHAEPIPASFPWRTATVVVGAVAAVELVVLIGIGAVHLAPKHHATAAAPPVHRAAIATTLPASTRAGAPAPHPLRPRALVKVLVLNGNGVQGAAATAAEHLQIWGYTVGGAQNAQRHDYAQSMVMYAPGWAKEARRLAHDESVRLVAPVDGLTPATLKGSKIVLILGT